MIRNLLTFLFILVVATMLRAQSYTHGDGAAVISTCSGSFADAGGTNGNYPNNANIFQTFKASNNRCLSIKFSSFEVNDGDLLLVYDGETTNAPLIAILSGNNNPGSITSANGNLSFEFVSNGNGTAAGWVANFSCETCPISTVQDCSGAIPACQAVYDQPNSFIGIGNYDEINRSLSCIASGERNSVWYTFTMESNGDLHFNITPKNLTDDYDWVLFNLTDKGCEDIIQDRDMQVSCNYNPATGITGANGGSNRNSQGAGTTESQHNDVVGVKKGETYALMISNYSATQSGYQLDFSQSTARPFQGGQGDNIKPAISLASGTPNCGDNKLLVSFSETIRCATIDASDFKLQGPSQVHNITAARGGECNKGGLYETEVELTIDPPISETGNYVLTIPGSITDACGNGAVGSIEFILDGFEIDAFSVDESCADACDGSARVAVTASGNYTVAWSTSPIQTTESIENLCAGAYAVTVFDNKNCTSKETVNVAAGIKAEKPIVTTPVLYCVDDNSTPLQAQGSGIRWYDDIRSPTPLGSTPIPSTAAPGDFIWYATQNTQGCESERAPVMVEVRENPVVELSASNVEICSGNTFSVMLSSTNEVATFEWVVIDASDNVVGFSSGSGLNEIAQTLSTTSLDIGFVEYEVVAMGKTPTNCKGAATVLRVEVVPEPEISAGGNQTVCADQTVILDGTVQGSSRFYWESDGDGVFADPTSQATNYTFGNGDISRKRVTIRLVAENSCATYNEEIEVTVLPAFDPYFEYSSSYYCKSGGNTSPVVNPNGPGQFSANKPGLVFQNATTGVVNMGASSFGNYIITFTTSGQCSSTHEEFFQVIDKTDANFIFPKSYCINGGENPVAVLANGASKGIFSALSNGVVFADASEGEVDILQSVPGEYRIVNNIPAGNGCDAATDTSNLILVPADDASFDYTNAAYCVTGVDPVPEKNYNEPNAFFSSNSATLNEQTGELDLSNSGVGNHTIYFTTTGPCVNVDSAVIEVFEQIDPFFVFDSLHCTYDNQHAAFGAAVGQGLFEATPSSLIFIDSVNGLVDIGNSAVGTYSLLHQLPSIRGCAPVSSMRSFSILEKEDASFSYAQSTYCTNGDNPAPIIPSGATGLFTVNNNLLQVDSLTGAVTLSNALEGVYEITFFTDGFCPDTSATNFEIITAPDPSFTFDSVVYCKDDFNPKATGNGVGLGVFRSNPVGVSFVRDTFGEINLVGTVNGTYDVINFIEAANGCAAEADTMTIAFDDRDIAEFVYSAPFYCEMAPDQAVLKIDDAQSGVFSVSPLGLDLNANDGQILIGSSAIGTYNINFKTDGICPAERDINLSIVPTPNPNFEIERDYCNEEEEPAQLVKEPTTVLGVISSIPSTGLDISNGTGEIDLQASLPGKYTIYNVLPESESCPRQADSAEIVINPTPVANSGISESVLCAGEQAQLSAQGGVMYTWAPINKVENGTVNTTRTNTMSTTTYTVSVFNRFNCVDTSQVKLTVNPLPITVAGNDTSICVFQEITLGGVAPDTLFAPTVYYWTPEDSILENGIYNPVVMPFQNITYRLTSIDDNGCTNSDEIVVKVNDLPEAFILGNASIRQFEETTLIAYGGVSYLWSPDENISNPEGKSIKAAPEVTTTYSVAVTDWNGCVSFDSVRLVVSPLSIPSAFTPDNDGSNDYFEVIVGGEFELLDMTITNRWGQVVYQSNDTRWDGTFGGVQQPLGVYSYVVRVKQGNNRLIIEKGHLTLLR